MVVGAGDEGDEGGAGAAGGDGGRADARVDWGMGGVGDVLSLAQPPTTAHAAVAVQIRNTKHRRVIRDLVANPCC